MKEKALFVQAGIGPTQKIEMNNFQRYLVSSQNLGVCGRNPSVLEWETSSSTHLGEGCWWLDGVSSSVGLAGKLYSQFSIVECSVLLSIMEGIIIVNLEEIRFATHLDSWILGEAITSRRR